MQLEDEQKTQNLRTLETRKTYSLTQQTTQSKDD